jgi:hypothetical protein
VRHGQRHQLIRVVGAEPIGEKRGSGEGVEEAGVVAVVEDAAGVVEHPAAVLVELHYGKDRAPTGPDNEHAATSMLALHLLQSSLVHVDTLLLQRIFAEPGWAKKQSDEDRRG